MDRNSLIGWTLMGLLMVALMYVMQQQRPEPPAAEPAASSDTTSFQAPAPARETLAPDETVVLQGEDPVVADSARQADVSRRFGSFAAHMSGSEDTLRVENDKLLITFSNKGGVPVRVELKEYVTHAGRPLVVYSNRHGRLDVAFSAVIEDGLTAGFHTEDLYFEPLTETAPDGSTVVRYRINSGPDSYYEHEYRIPATGYKLGFNLNASKFQNVIYKRQDFFELTWNQRMQSLEDNIQTERMYSSLYYADADYGTDRLKPQRSVEKAANYTVKWVSFKQKFFSSVLLTPNGFSPGSKLAATVPDSKDYVKDVSATVSMDYDEGDMYSFPMEFYFGPNRYKLLKGMDVNLHKSMQLGTSVIRWVNVGIIIPMFNFLSRFTNNYGLIILLLTIFIKLIVTPFTYKSYLSMVKMRVLQPELTELRAKYGKDQQKMGAAQMELYRKAGVNPLGGCLPMLFQFPILVAMYRFFPASIELRQEGFLWAKDLSTYDSIFSWTTDIPILTQVYGNHISLFTILMAVTSFFYTKLNSQNTPNDPNNPMAAQMKMFTYIMPFMLIFIFNKFSAALSYYYFLFNLLSIGQQYLMQRFVIDEDKIHAQIQENKKKVRTKSKWQIRMEEMMKQQQEAQKNRGKKR